VLVVVDGTVVVVVEVVVVVGWHSHVGGGVHGVGCHPWGGTQVGEG
jgi:hypothetical protein